MTPDVVVIGGGPAGLGAAIACARHGLAVTLIERHACPIDKPCGEGLLPNGVDALGRLGISPDRLAACGHPIAGIRYYSRKGRMAHATFTGGQGLGLRRLDLSQVLIEQARTYSCLEMLTGTPATLEIAGGRPIVMAGNVSFSPRLVVAADGLHSHVRTSLGITSVGGVPRRWGLRQHFGGEPWTDHVEVYFGQGFEAYVTPVAGGVNVALLWEPDRVRTSSRESLLKTLVNQIPALARRLDGRAATDRVKASGPFNVHVPQPWRAGVLLLGDASGYVDALTGEGVGLALAQANILEVAVIPTLLADSSRDLVDADVLAATVGAMRAAAAPNHQLTRILLRISRHAELVERLIGALAADQALFQHCLDVNMGRRKLWRMPAGSLTRLPAALAMGR